MIERNSNYFVIQGLAQRCGRKDALGAHREISWAPSPSVLCLASEIHQLSDIVLSRSQPTRAHFQTLLHSPRRSVSGASERDGRPPRPVRPYQLTGLVGVIFLTPSVFLAAAEAAISLAHSMNSRAAGLSAWFFNVTTATGHGPGRVIGTSHSLSA